jgi:histone acetyltransferase (RNA polymerase elongator complex component)
MKTHITAPIFIPHAGCPNQCIFCNQHLVSGENTAHKNPTGHLASSVPDDARIEKTVTDYLSAAAPDTHRELAFFGGSFTGLDTKIQERLLEKALFYKRSGRVDAIRLSTRPDYISPEILDRLRAFEVDTVELGIQSFDDGVLERTRRGHTVQDSFGAIGLLRERGFSFVIQLLPGLPGETRESALRTAHFAAEQKPDGIRIYPAVVLADTPMEALYRDGRYTPLTLEEAVELCAQMSELFFSHRIPVLRTGIHPLSDLGVSTVAAGPYHPAFGFLVRARMRRNELKKMIDDEARRGFCHIRIALPGTYTEEYIGHRRENILWLETAFPALRLQFETDRSSTCPSIHCTD